jgi:hypothetical protein
VLTGVEANLHEVVFSGSGDLEGRHVLNVTPDQSD